MLSKLISLPFSVLGRLFDVIGTALGVILRPIWRVLLSILNPVYALGKKLVLLVAAIIWTIVGPFLKPVLNILDKTPLGKVARGTGGYFKGAYNELDNVKWPTNKETWSMAGVVALFTIALTLFIVIVDGIIGELMRRLIS